MYEKLVTFEEEKRSEHLYLLFNSVFVCACLICFFEPIFNVPMLFVDDIVNDSVRWFFETLLRPLCLSAAALCPFFIYNIRMHKSFRRSLKPENNKVSAGYYVLGLIAVVAAVPFFVHMGELFCDSLISDGYIVNEVAPDFGQGAVANVFYIIYTSAVTAFLLDLAFKGVAAEKLSHAHVVPALLVPAFIAAVQTVSLLKMFYVFVAAVVVGWCYLKTHSLYLSVVLTFGANVSFYVTQLIKQSNSEWYEANILLVSVVGLAVGIAAFVVLALKKGIKLERPEPSDSEEEYDRINGKQAIVGLLKSFGFWIVILIFLFRIFFTYLELPTFEIEGESGEVVTEQQTEIE